MAKTKKGDVASWLESISWTLTHQDDGSPGEVDVDQHRVGRTAAGIGAREASYSARNNKTGHDITMPSLQRLLDAVNEYEAIQRPA